MTERIAHNAAALIHLLPLMEAHLDKHGSIVPRAQWESTYEPPPKGYVPPPPEPDCDGRCPVCPDFDRRCDLREEAWIREWERLWHQYEELHQLDGLLQELTVANPHWHSALYWVHVQPWDRFETERRKDWEKAGREWLAKECDGWLPMVEPPVVTRTVGPKDRDIIELRIEGLSYHAIAKQLGCSKTTIRAVLLGKEIRQGRMQNAGGA
jgi:hypothetical protein